MGHTHVYVTAEKLGKRNYEAYNNHGNGEQDKRCKEFAKIYFSSFKRQTVIEGKRRRRVQKAKKYNGKQSACADCADM